jgi:hypothetical protein
MSVILLTSRVNISRARDGSTPPRNLCTLLTFYMLMPLTPGLTH